MVNMDHLAERLRERVLEESDWDTLCDSCGATLTATDRQAGYCTQCGEGVIDAADESADEHLWED